ncbi:MltG/YceG/YrrL family protein [Tepidibacter thalassicus]|uniref:YceG-like family protein n=1 Tax=Tepidibacter thalassicus DSM 15285 TaxID=1123350 RepID=A0A1M5TF80_9FIRM|nr:hypothetical protein [Tepidibacter thalassicus]SHH49369.1 hypothetical protein SAMN02744040_02146 [Tepidibacter thalassicus DSM 15285]
MKRIIFCIFILGLSLGVIISSSLNLIYSKNNVKIEETVNNHLEIKEKNKEREKKQPKKEEEYVTIKIENGYTCDEISELLYKKGLINNKEDFKIMFNLKTLDIFKSGQALTNRGLISRGWQINTLLNILGKNYDKVLNVLYDENLINDRESFDFFLSILKETRRIIPGQKTIKKGSSINEIIEILTN